MLDLNAYLAAPCRESSIPYWKAETIRIPDNMLILHDADFRKALLADYADDPYFRLLHDLRDIPAIPLQDAFCLTAATVEEYAAHIAACCDDVGICAKELAEYQRRDVYCAELWLAVREKSTGQMVASGIGELDRRIGEGVLEWIQVSPGYRGRGLGRCVVLELLRRMQGQARFATVSGRRCNLTKPERLYRQCGFTGQDVWHILRKK